MGAILIEDHKRIMKETKRRALKIHVLGLVALFMVVGLVMFRDVDRTMTLEVLKSMRSEYDAIRAKQRLIIALRTKPLTVSQVLDVVDTIVDQSHRSGIPVSITLGILEVESEFIPWAVSNKGAKGLGQLMPATFAAYTPVKDSKAIFDPILNIRSSVLYIEKLKIQFGDWRRTLKAYYGGEGLANNTKNKDLDVYVTAVLKRASEFEGKIAYD